MTPSELAKVAQWLGPYWGWNYNDDGRTVVWKFDDRRISDADLLLACLERLAEEGWRVELSDDGPERGPRRYWCEGTRYGETEIDVAQTGPTWLAAVLAAVLEVAK